jgi:hypothetical protein
VARFEYFRKNPRQAGVWLVRQEEIRFVLPITTGPRPGVSDYLPAPYDLPGFAPPVEQQLPTVTPFIELADGRTIVAGDGADEIHAGEDGHSLRAVWKHWAQIGGKPGQTVEAGLTTEVTWSFTGRTLIRTETISSSQAVAIKRFWFAVPSTCSVGVPPPEGVANSYILKGEGGDLQVSLGRTSFPLNARLEATGNSPMGKGSQGAVPLILHLEAKDLAVRPGRDLTWSISLESFAQK